MNIQFIDEPDSDLVKRKSLYLDPESELSILLSKVQDSIEQEGFTVDRSRYKYIKGRLCKFNIELINEPDIATLNRRSNSMKKLSLNLSKLKWEFQSRSFSLKIGKIQDKDLYILVAFVAEELNEPERERIKNVKDKIVKGDSTSPKESSRVSFKEFDETNSTQIEDGSFEAPISPLLQQKEPKTDINREPSKSILKKSVTNDPIKKVSPPVVMMSPSYTPTTTRPPQPTTVQSVATTQQPKVQNYTQVRSNIPPTTRSTSMFKIRG